MGTPAAEAPPLPPEQPLPPQLAVGAQVFFDCPLRGWALGSVVLCDSPAPGLYSCWSPDGGDFVAANLPAERIVPVPDSASWGAEELVSPACDLAALRWGHDAAVAEALRARYVRGLCCTNLGRDVVCVNPFAGEYDAEYSISELARAADPFAAALPPRPTVLSVARRALTAAGSGPARQCVVAHGAAGSGKTRAASAALDYYVHAARAGMAEPGALLRAALGLLGCMGSAPDGATCFPSVVWLRISRRSGLVSARIVAGPPAAATATGAPPLRLLRAAAELSMGQQGGADFAAASTAMRHLGVTASEAAALWAAAQGVAALVGLCDGATDAAVRIAAAAPLLGVTPPELAAALGGCGAGAAAVLAEELYCLLFDWAVARANAALAAAACGADEVAEVGVADGPGFWDAGGPANGAARLALNSWGEGLQALYDAAVFSAEPRSAAADGVAAAARPQGHGAAAECWAGARRLLLAAAAAPHDGWRAALPQGQGEVKYAAEGAQGGGCESARRLLASRSSSPLVRELLRGAPHIAPAGRWAEGAERVLSELRQPAERCGLHWALCVTSHPSRRGRLWDGPSAQAQLGAMRVGAAARVRRHTGGVRLPCSALRGELGGLLRVRGTPHDVALGLLHLCAARREAQCGELFVWATATAEARLAGARRDAAAALTPTVQSFCRGRLSAAGAARRRRLAAGRLIAWEAKRFAMRFFTGTERAVAAVERGRERAARGTAALAPRAAAVQWEELHCRGELEAAEAQERKAAAGKANAAAAPAAAGAMRAAAQELGVGEHFGRSGVGDSERGAREQLLIACEQSLRRAALPQLRRGETLRRGEWIRAESEESGELLREHACGLLARQPTADGPPGLEGAERSCRWLVADGEARRRRRAAAAARLAIRCCAVRDAPIAEDHVRRELCDAERAERSALRAGERRGAQQALQRDEQRHPLLGRGACAGAEQAARSDLLGWLQLGRDDLHRGEAAVLELEVRSIIERRRRSELRRLRHDLLAAGLLWLQGGSVAGSRPGAGHPRGEPPARAALRAAEKQERLELMHAARFGAEGLLPGREGLALAAAEEAEREGLRAVQSSELLRFSASAAAGCVAVLREGLSDGQWLGREAVERRERRRRRPLTALWRLLGSQCAERVLRGHGLELEVLQRAETAARAPAERHAAAWWQLATARAPWLLVQHPAPRKSWGPAPPPSALPSR